MYEDILKKLSASPFRRRFCLGEKEKSYIEQKGLATIERHAADFVAKRLAPAFPPSDGKQTPMRGHPVFIAQHAMACCCRQCLYKWHKINLGVDLSSAEQAYIVGLLMTWITQQISSTQQEHGTQA